jgi:hypothetical protein
MEQRPSWQVNGHSATQEVIRLSWDPKFHYHVHKSPPLVPFLSQNASGPHFPNLFPKIHSNIFFLSTPRSSGYFFSGFLNSLYAYICLISPVHATFPVHIVLLDLITVVIFGGAYKLWSFSSCSLLRPSANSFLLKYSLQWTVGKHMSS